MTDIAVEHRGTLTTLRPLTQRAGQWLAGYTTGAQPWWPAIFIEPGRVAAVLAGAVAAGLTVQQ